MVSSVAPTASVRVGLHGARKTRPFPSVLPARPPREPMTTPGAGRWRRAIGKAGRGTPPAPPAVPPLDAAHCAPVGSE
jgi:hypothetical protein